MELTDFYKENPNDISFGQNNATFFKVDYLRLFNKKSEQELLTFFQKFMDEDVFTRRVYILRELYVAKQHFNSFMFELLENLSQQAKEKIAMGLNQEGIDVVDVRTDALFIKSQYKDQVDPEIVRRHLSADRLDDLDEIDLEGEEIVYALLQTEENVGVSSGPNGLFR